MYDTPKFKSLYEEFLEADEERRGLLPLPHHRRLGEPTQELNFTPELIAKISQSTERFERARGALNEYCRRHGESESF